MADTILPRHVHRTIERLPKMPMSAWNIIHQIECHKTRVTIPVSPARACELLVDGDRLTCVHDRPLGRWEVTLDLPLDVKPLSARRRKELVNFVRFNVAVARQQL